MQPLVFRYKNINLWITRVHEIHKRLNPTKITNHKVFILGSLLIRKVKYCGPSSLQVQSGAERISAVEISDFIKLVRVTNLKQLFSKLQFVYKLSTCMIISKWVSVTKQVCKKYSLELQSLWSLLTDTCTTLLQICPGHLFLSSNVSFWPLNKTGVY